MGVLGLRGNYLLMHRICNPPLLLQLNIPVAVMVFVVIIAFIYDIIAILLFAVICDTAVKANIIVINITKTV